MVSLSIVMTCYNLEKYVAEALRSVFDQDYKGPMELIVVDDCSTDNTLANIKETVAAYGSGWKVQVVQPEHNLGVAGATDYGWQFAKNDWIVMVDGDDVQYPDRCRNTANLVERHPQAMMLACSADHANEAGNVYGYQGYCWKPYDESPEEMYLDTPAERVENFTRPDGYPKWSIFGCCMAVRRSLYQKWGNLVTNTTCGRIAQDPTWALRAYASGPILGSRIAVCKYRAHSGNILNKAFEWEKLSAWFTREKHMQRFHELQNRNTRQMLQDLDRISQEPELSDCTMEQISAMRAFAASQQSTYEILCGWWSYSWFKRLAIAFNNPLPSNFKRWPIPRLLPFWVFVTMRWLVKQKLRRKG